MKLHLPIPPDFSFQECINAHGWKHLLPFYWDADGAKLSRVEQFSGCRPTLLTIYSEGDSVIVDTADDVPADETLNKVSQILQLHLSMTEFHNYCSASDELQQVPQLKQGRILRSPTVWEDVVKTFCKV